MQTSSKPILRFAPSPNGFLHLGHAYSALFTAHWANQIGGQWRLRIEDIDKGRSRSEFIEAIYEDLSWLGLSWPEPVLMQSKRGAAYKRAANKLRKMDLLYPCFCTREQIRAHSNGVCDPDGAPVYPGTCRHLSPREIKARLEAGDKAQYRLDSARAIEKTGMLTFSVAGPTPADRPQIRYARPGRWGDVVVQRKDIATSYHLAVVVDDATEGITHITRGRDLEAATDIHVLLQFLLGFPSPLYTFHKLIVDNNEMKLSKSKGSPGLRDLREAGWSPKDIRNRLGF
ncbi:Glutamyl-Q tRNA(Asp) synthetase [hydrothermal vent metagenome]|uniref:Glutamyl-Q tRNA(Asp) synthetase n=1 Tax=hydrothermal vent metagenome TaxID=652676 RepID=A0A3B0U4R1_9ZZZZ